MNATITAKYTIGETVTVMRGILPRITGTVVKDDGGKWVTVKHDNFAGEVFERAQIIPNLF